MTLSDSIKIYDFLQGLMIAVCAVLVMMIGCNVMKKYKSQRQFFADTREPATQIAAKLKDVSQYGDSATKQIEAEFAACQMNGDTAYINKIGELICTKKYTGNILRLNKITGTYTKSEIEGLATRIEEDAQQAQHILENPNAYQNMPQVVDYINAESMAAPASQMPMPMLGDFYGIYDITPYNYKATEGMAIQLSYVELIVLGEDSLPVAIYPIKNLQFVEHMGQPTSAIQIDLLNTQRTPNAMLAQLSIDSGKTLYMYKNRNGYHFLYDSNGLPIVKLKQRSESGGHS